MGRDMYLIHANNVDTGRWYQFTCVEWKVFGLAIWKSYDFIDSGSFD